MFLRCHVNNRATAILQRQCADFAATLAARAAAQREHVAALRQAAALAPDPAAIRRHLSAVFRDVPGGALFELRGIAEGRPARARLFPATGEGFADAAAVAAAWNREGLNLYAGVHLRRPGTPRDRAASAGDVMGGARWCVADLDGAPEAEARLRALPVPPRFVVTTGTAPRWRGHAWWRLAEPVALAEWTPLQRDLAAFLDADPSLADPARVVRLAGTVSWPKESKRARGYRAELTRGEPWRDAPREVSAAELFAMIGAASKGARDTAEDPDDWTADVETRPALPAPSMARIRSALAFLDPEPRDMWLRVGAALKAQAAETGNDVEPLFVEWARGDLRHDGARVPRTFQGEGDCVALLKTLRRDGGEAKDGPRVTVASIFREAKLAGWRDPGELLGDEDLGTFPETFGDRSNGARFARMHRGRLLFVGADKRWRSFDGVRWTASDGREMEAAKKTADAILTEAAAAVAAKPSDDAARRNHALALNVHRFAQRHREMLAMAQSEQGMRVRDVGAFDADPFLLGVPNGAVDLRTGRLLAPDPALLVSRITGAPFEPDATAPRWLQFLRDVFGGDATLCDFIRRAVGYTLTGDVREEVMFFAHGEGRNGKSVFANILAGVFGGYATIVGAELLARRGSDSEAARLRLRLPGARLALANETGEGDTFHDARLKELVSRERIPARALYGEAFDFQPTHKIWMRGNHKPAVLDGGDGFWRRLVLIPFAVTFPPGGPEDLDSQILDAEAPGVLAWAVRGAIEWQRHGLDVPAALRAATAEYREAADVLAEWWRTSIRHSPGATLLVGAAYSDARRFFAEAGLAAPSRPAFIRRVARFGMRREREGKAAEIFRNFALAGGGGDVFEGGGND